MSALGCPACGSRDAVPKRVIVHFALRRRWWLFGPIIAAPEVVGNVNLCAKCATEWNASPAGVYVPKVDWHPQVQRGEASEQRHPLNDEPRNLRDSDMPWEKARR